MYVIPAGRTKNENDVRAALVLRLCKLDTLVNTEADEGVGAATAELRTLEVARALDGNLKYTNSRVDRLAGEHLLKVQRKDVRLIHHGAEDTMNGVANESR